jgi:hypothetical protein
MKFFRTAEEGRCPAGTYETYRRMRSDPTISLARAAALTPVKRMKWAVEGAEDAPEDRVDFVRDVVEWMLPKLIDDILRMVDFGFQVLEKVWARDGGRLVLERIKPLSPDSVRPLLDKATGRLIGARQGGVDLPMSKVVWATYDGECDDPWGRSRHENVREFAWHPWREAVKKFGTYVSKHAGIVPIIMYPPGTSEDSKGQTVDNFEVARRAIDAITAGRGMTMPNVLSPWAEDLVRKGASAKDLAAWRLELLGSPSGAGSEIVEGLRYYDSLKLRGWLVPERAATEGQYGTKAEASEHHDLAVDIAEELADLVVAIVNEQVVDPLLVYNFGEEAEGTVYVCVGGVSEEDKAWFRSLVKDILTANPDMVPLWLSIDSVIDMADLPKAQDDLGEVARLPAGPAPDPNTDPNLPRPPLSPDADPEADPLADPLAEPAAQPQGGTVVQDLALNGAQISSLKEICIDVVEKKLPPEAAENMILVSFPSIDPAMVKKIIASLRAHEPPPEPPPQFPGGPSDLGDPEGGPPRPPPKGGRGSPPKTPQEPPRGGGGT